MSPKYLHFKIILFVFILQIMSSVLVPVLNAPEKGIMIVTLISSQQLLINFFHIS